MSYWSCLLMLEMVVSFGDGYVMEYEKEQKLCRRERSLLLRKRGGPADCACSGINEMPRNARTNNKLPALIRIRAVKAALAPAILKPRCSQNFELERSSFPSITAHTTPLSITSHQQITSISSTTSKLNQKPRRNGTKGSSEGTFHFFWRKRVQN